MAGIVQPGAQSAAMAGILMSWTQRWWRWGPAFLLAAFAMAAAAQPQAVLQLEMAQQPIPLGTAGQFWMDPTGDAIVDNVATRTDIPWAATQPNAVYPTSTGKALWLRFTVAELDDRDRWYLEVPYPAVNLVTLYSPDRLGQWVPQHAGDSLPVARWPLPGRHPVLPLALVPDSPRRFLLRVENPHSFGAPLSFVSEAHFNREEQRAALVLGMYFGLAGLAVLLSLLGAVSLRDIAFAWYALAITVMSLAQSSMTGLAGVHLWPTWAWWNDVSALALPVLGVASLMGFFSTVVSARERSRRVHRLLLAMGLLGVAAAIGIMTVEPSLRFRLMVPYVALGSTAGVGTLLWAFRRGDRHAGWLLAGLVPVVIGAFFPLARTAGLIPIGFWTMHAMQISIAIELPLLLLVLMLRSQQRRENQRRIHGLDRMDPATGLINGLVFTERLARLIARSQRLKLQSAVLVIDIANIEHIRRTFDRRSVEELPLRVAGRLLSAAREIDSVARLSDFRFGMLVEGPLTPEEAASTGPRVVARCLMPFKDKPLEWTAQVRVAQTLVPTESFDAERVIARLEAVLATVPADSKRAVFTIR
jgi:GGDEF domain-containing protein